MTDQILTVRCACGWEVKGREADVIPRTIEHGRRLHNMEATRDQVLAMATPEEPEPSGDHLGSLPLQPPMSVAADRLRGEGDH